MTGRGRNIPTRLYDKLDRAINSETQRSSRWMLYQVAVIGGFIGGLVVYMLFRVGIIR